MLRNILVSIVTAILMFMLLGASNPYQQEKVPYEPPAWEVKIYVVAYQEAFEAKTSFSNPEGAAFNSAKMYINMIKEQGGD